MQMSDLRHCCAYLRPNEFGFALIFGSNNFSQCISYDSPTTPARFLSHWISEGIHFSFTPKVKRDRAPREKPRGAIPK
ncbi:hypothetical protein CEXT_608971 [Caerostris extrusa]|uniref:Uncharacterized protein n=1 Tax=Caerostris extrusa TaxID=172846 RepID=A0AAV4XGW5_CAEEX|nr:hypothetical protein CEXT_608971 [Caerostris extrusa]